MSDFPLLVAVPALPLLGALIVALFGSKLKELSHWPIVIAIAGSFLCSLGVLSHVRDGVAKNAESHAQVGYEEVVTLWKWAEIPHAYTQVPETGSKIVDTAGKSLDSVPLHIDIVLRADPLTAIMLCMVTFISTLVAIYAAGYMHGDRSYWRFFSYIGLFVFSMTMLVSVSNFALLFVFWEAVGACSYLLIGFWYQKPEAAAAGKKAFLVNRVGDFGFALALFLIWSNYGTLDYHDAHGVAGVLGQTRLADPSLFVAGGVAVAICGLLLVGCCGKSAQLPLHVWLPDAMEGPTPVSALIHAATMVTAGVYLVTRCTPLYFAAGTTPICTFFGGEITAQMLVSIVGGATALMAGLIALTQNDLKRVLAYSTVSQLGYMFLALGTGSLMGIVAGMFHLFTHAFFKALLFLGSGSVMHAMGHIIDMRRFSGLRKIMPVTHWTFLVGCLALAGMPIFAGFWSKDDILASLHEAAHPHAAHHDDSHASNAADPYNALQAGSRTTFVSVPGIDSLPISTEHGVRVTSTEATSAASIEAQPTFANRVYGLLYYVAVGAAGLTAFYTFRAYYLTFYGELKVPPEAGSHAHESPSTMTGPLVILAVCAVLVGVVFGHPTHAFSHLLQQTPSLAYKTVRETNVESGFHWDIAFWGTAVGLVGIALASYLYLGDKKEAAAIAKASGPLYDLSYNKFFIDQLYLIFIVFPLTALAYLLYAIDRWLIDGTVNLVGALPVRGGQAMRLLQNGMIQFYALAMVLGLIVLAWGIVYYGG
ncbi:MAG: NADH-quinone oxidoreductase subunit L [Pirellulales bacterium]